MRSEQNEREEFSPKAPADGEDNVKGKMEPEWTMFKSSSAGKVVEIPEKSRLSCREIQPTTDGGCRYADGRGSEQGGSIISPQAVIGVKPGETYTN